MALPELVLIAAVARNGIIGSDNDMPWRLPSDLKYFKRLTLGKPVIMGRKTFLSFGGKPLPGRPHVIVSRDPDYAPEGAEAATSLEEALRRGMELAADLGVDQVMCIGGGSFMPRRSVKPTVSRSPKWTRSRRETPAFRTSIRRCGRKSVGSRASAPNATAQISPSSPTAARLEYLSDPFS